MRMANHGAVRGTRVGAGPVGEPYGRGLAVDKVVVLYHCANGHRTTVPFVWTATIPPQWECRVCSEPAGTDPLDPPPRAARYMGKMTHLGLSDEAAAAVPASPTRPFVAEGACAKVW